MIITIDGPTASGKGSLAKAIAAHTGFFYLDTGLLYRAVGYLVAQTYSQEAVIRGDFWTTDLLHSYKKRLVYHYAEGMAHIAVDGVDCTGALRTPLIDWYASHVSSVPLVRQELRALQRALGNKHNVVIDGRDCGTVLFPAAEYKFFITASLETRVQRAYADKVRRAQDMSFAESERAVLLRDLRDLSRSISPLRPADDAVILDTTSLGLEASIVLVLSYIV